MLGPEFVAPGRGLVRYAIHATNSAGGLGVKDGVIGAAELDIHRQAGRTDFTDTEN